MEGILAIIFDFDGVVIDSMPLMTYSFIRYLKNYGIELKEEDMKKYYGWTGVNVIKDIFTMHGIKRNAEIANEERKKIYVKNIEKVKVYPGFIEVIKKVKGKYKTALVTSSSSEIVELIMNIHNLNQLFDVIVTKDDVKKSKPDLEPYLLAIKKLAVEPNKCMVVEDTPIGIKSAKAAGTYCIAVTSSCAKEELNEADLIVDSVDKII